MKYITPDGTVKRSTDSIYLPESGAYTPSMLERVALRGKLLDQDERKMCRHGYSLLIRSQNHLHSQPNMNAFILYEAQVSFDDAHVARSRITKETMEKLLSPHRPRKELLFISFTKNGLEQIGDVEIVRNPRQGGVLYGRTINGVQAHQFIDNKHFPNWSRGSEHIRQGLSGYVPNGVGTTFTIIETKARSPSTFALAVRDIDGVREYLNQVKSLDLQLLRS